MKKSFQIFYIIVTIAFSAIIFTACNNGQNGATKAIEAYIQALSSKDSVKISNLSCSSWEQNALLEVDSLTAVGAKVENLSCEQTGQSGTDTYISCTGSITLDYNGESQKIDLSTRTYIARQEAGDWRMCGYR